MTDKDKRELQRVLEASEALAHMVSEDHPHPCPTGEVARAIGHAAAHGLQLLAGGAGPAQVANAAYRSNWDTIFGAKQTIGVA